MFCAILDLAYVVSIAGALAFVAYGCNTVTHADSNFATSYQVSDLDVDNAVLSGSQELLVPAYTKDKAGNIVCAIADDSDAVASEFTLRETATKVVVVDSPELVRLETYSGKEKTSVVPASFYRLCDYSYTYYVLYTTGQVSGEEFQSACAESLSSSKPKDASVGLR